MPVSSIDLKVKEQGKAWLLPPYNYSVRKVAKELDVALGSVSKWRQQLVTEGKMEQDKTAKINNDLTAEQIFGFVIETATMSERELADYCRQKGLFVEQIKEWRVASIQAHQAKSTVKHDPEKRHDKRRIKQLEKELARKDKALAETAALLVLREKFNAVWDNSEED